MAPGVIQSVLKQDVYVSHGERYEPVIYCTLFGYLKESTIKNVQLCYLGLSSPTFQPKKRNRAKYPRQRFSLVILFKEA